MANGWGGARPGAGRPKGVGSTRKKRLSVLMHETEGKRSPLQYLVAVLNDPEETPARRMEAAIAATPYLHCRLSPLLVTAPSRVASDGVPILDLSPVPSQGPRVTQLIISPVETGAASAPLARDVVDVPAAPEDKPPAPVEAAPEPETKPELEPSAEPKPLITS